MNAVVRQPETAVSAPTEAATVLQVIERAASNPAVDIDKLERLLQMRERMQAQEAERAFNVALNAAQSEVSRIAADATNPQTRSQYATYAKLDKVLRPIYTRHGFSLSFDEADSPKPEHVRVLCHLSHVSGHTRVYHKDMPADGKGAKGGDVMTKTHASGAAQSYGMRYLVKGIFNIAIGEEDTDGNEPGKPLPRITDDQAATLRDMIEATGTNKAAMLAAYKVETIEELQPAAFDHAMAILRKRVKK